MQYSVFGSILTIGGIIGALVNGKLTDFIGRRRVSFPSFLGLFQIVIM